MHADEVVNSVADQLRAAGIEVFVRGREAWTTQQVAEAYGYTLAGMRATLRQAGIQPVDMLDGRTPLYDPEEVQRVLTARPGVGAPGRPRNRRSN